MFDKETGEVLSTGKRRVVSNTVRMVFSVDGVRRISRLFLYELSVLFMGWYRFFWEG